MNKRTNNSLKNDRLSIILLSKSYILSTRKIREAEINARCLSYDEIRSTKYIVDHLEKVITQLDDKEAFIIENEVINGKKGKWYLEYFSPSSYYRTRKKAYRDYLRILEE